MKLEYREGYEGGWSDDLGYISDRNTWLPTMPTGWYLYSYTPAAQAWAMEHLRSCKCANGSYVILDEKDAVLFKLKWS